ncbi:MAG: hypothetical protein ACE10C_15995 [Candidatus Binatia bacterium]
MALEHHTFAEQTATLFRPLGKPSPPTSIGSFGAQELKPEVTPHAEPITTSTGIQSLSRFLQAGAIFVPTPQPFFLPFPVEKTLGREESLFGTRRDFRGDLRDVRPLEAITTFAGDFIRRHLLSSAVEHVIAIVRDTYRHVEQVTIDVKEDPEVEGYRWLAVTIRIRGDVEEILDAERRTRRHLRTMLSREDYRKFVLSYEVAG